MNEKKGPDEAAVRALMDAVEANYVSIKTSCAALARAVAMKMDVAMNADDVAMNARDVAMNSRDVAMNSDDVAMNARDVAMKARDVAMNARDVAMKARDVAMNVDIPEQIGKEGEHSPKVHSVRMVEREDTREQVREGARRKREVEQYMRKQDREMARQHALARKQEEENHAIQHQQWLATERERKSQNGESEEN